MLDEANAIRRRRECERIVGQDFTTFEHIEVSPLIVVKKMEHVNNFKRKILNGLERSCEKDQLDINNWKTLLIK